MGFLNIQLGNIFANVIRCFRLGIRVGYFIYFDFTPAFFYLMMLFNEWSLIQLKEEIKHVKYLFKSYS